MINEILCASSVRGRVIAALLSLLTLCLAACGGATPVADREAELNASIRRIQIHEAAIDQCRCSAAVCDRAIRICDEATLLSDADIDARCHQATHACEAQTAGHDQGCACD